MNLKLRLQNPATLTALIAALVAFVYQVLSIMGITTTIDQSFFVQLGGVVVTLLVALGVIVDPTTAGIDDSAQALAYKKPKDDTAFPKNSFTADDFERLLNTTEESADTVSTTKFIRLKGHTIYWGAEKPTTANKGDYYIDQLNNDLIHQYDGNKWVASNLYAIVNEGD